MHVNPTVPVQVDGDSLRVKQILYNLVGNAIKYTNEGSVSVTVGLSRQTVVNTAPLVEIKVIDTGIGIAESQLDGIFEPFATVGPPSRRSSGLGLALADRLAAVMGGRISVSSVEGKGSIFTVSLPLKALENEPVTEFEATALYDGNRWHEDSNVLLVVDDKLLVRELLSSLLESEGWDIVQAESAKQAMAIIRHTQCRAVITDQQMPEKSGLELAADIRGYYAQTGSRPVLIMMTGGMSREQAAHAADEFDALLFKPIKSTQISSAIADAMSRDSSHDSLAVS